MTKTDNRKGRTWIRVQLGNAPNDLEIVAIVQQWKTQRRATSNLTRAVQLYEALLRGDTSLLSEYFPGFSVGASKSQPVRKVLNAAPVITRVAKSAEQDLLDAVGGVGFDNLEF